MALYFYWIEKIGKMNIAMAQAGMTRINLLSTSKSNVHLQFCSEAKRANKNQKHPTLFPKYQKMEIHLSKEIHFGEKFTTMSLEFDDTQFWILAIHSSKQDKYGSLFERMTGQPAEYHLHGTR